MLIGSPTKTTPRESANQCADLSRLGNGERNLPEAKAREGRESGSERVNAQKNIAQGWSAATTLGKRPTKLFSLSSSDEERAGGEESNFQATPKESFSSENKSLIVL